MIEIIRAGKTDIPAIKNLLNVFGFAYDSKSPDDFYIAREANKPVGIVQFEDYDSFYLLSSLGVKTSHRKRGIAAALLRTLFQRANKDIYIFTILPEFFGRFGFKPINPPVDVSALKNPVECAACEAQKCVCMVKSPHDT